MLDDSNVDEPLVPELAELYKRDRRTYDEKVGEDVRK